VGVLVQSNFGGRLTIGGVPVWKELQPPQRAASGGGHGATQGRQDAGGTTADGSCMIVVATDAPLDARQLGRLAARAIHGMARVGSTGSSGSGDYVIAFSTTYPMPGVRASGSAQSTAEAPPALLAEGELSPLFEAVMDATEEALYNSLLRAITVRGVEGHTGEAIPISPLRKLLEKK
jgi:D-aminopeptidase